MSFGKSRALFQMEAKTGIIFNDVAGVDEAKEEFQEVVTFLKQPDAFTACLLYTSPSPRDRG